MNPNAEAVESACYPREQIEVIGFHFAEPYLHMLPWLGRGTDPARYVAHDVERELIAQQPGSRLIDVECTGEPEVVTNALQQAHTSVAQVAGLVASFPLSLRVKATDGRTWRLRVTQKYVATGLGEGSQREVRQDFNVIEASTV